MAKKILERLIDRLGQKSKRYQSGGRHRGYDKAAAFGLKALKAIPRVATFSGSKLLGIPAMMLGSQKAYGATVYDEHGVNKYTGEKDTNLLIVLLLKVGKIEKSKHQWKFRV